MGSIGCPALIKEKTVNSDKQSQDLEKLLIYGAEIHVCIHESRAEKHRSDLTGEISSRTKL